MMNSVTCYGQARHHFWGTYHSTIVLVAPDASGARDVAVAMGEGWEVSENNDTAVVFCGKDPELKAAHAQLKAFGADLDKVTSIRKSIDRGEPFTCKVIVTPAEQLALPL